MNCPNDHGPMRIVRDANKFELYKCSICEIEIGTIDQTAAIQKIMKKWVDDKDKGGI